jgi:hypothetical protein
MSATAADVYMEMVAEIGNLGRRMVFLEEAAADAYNRKLWAVVGELHEQRADVQAYRSELMRQMWAYRRRRVRESYL